MRKRGKDLEKLKSIVTTVAQGEPLDPKHRDHQLVGSWKRSRDCHLGPDWVLIYTADAQSLRFERTGPTVIFSRSESAKSGFWPAISPLALDELTARLQ